MALMLEDGLSYVAVHAGDALLSIASACANRGVDVDQDLAGTEHYAGGASINDNGDPYIPGVDGFLWSDAFVWSDGMLWSDGLLWTDSYLAADGFMSIGDWVEHE